jgi:hypothetical protein
MPCSLTARLQVLRCRCDRAAVRVSDDALVLLGPLQVAAGPAVVRVCERAAHRRPAVAAGPRAAMFEATGKGPRQASRTRHRRAIVRSRARPVASWLSPGRRPGPIARHPEAPWHAAWSPTSFGHRFAIVCLRTLQPQRKCGNPRKHGDKRRARDSAANRPHSPVEDARLKIVVSPVRVRVSPLPEPLQIARFSASAEARARV